MRSSQVFLLSIGFFFLFLITSCEGNFLYSVEFEIIPDPKAKKTQCKQIPESVCKATRFEFKMNSKFPFPVDIIEATASRRARTHYVQSNTYFSKFIPGVCNLVTSNGYYEVCILTGKVPPKTIKINLTWFLENLNEIQ